MSNVENLEDHMAYACKCGSVHFNLLKSSFIECSSCGLKLEQFWGSKQNKIEQQPIAWRWGAPKLKNGDFEWRYSLNQTRPDAIPLYTTPPQRKEPEQEPVAWKYDVTYNQDGTVSVALPDGDELRIVLPNQQEPYCWTWDVWVSGGKWRAEYGWEKPTEKVVNLQPLYTSPPQRTWVGLTDEEIKAFDTWHDNREEEVGWVNPSEIVAYIEAKLKEKNT
jgi:hypothetical protein